MTQITKSNTGDVLLDEACDRLSQLSLDALRWRALMGSPYMTTMGWAGFESPTSPQGDTSGYRHLTLNFWSIHDRGHFAEQEVNTLHAKDLLTKFTDECIKLQGLK